MEEKRRNDDDAPETAEPPEAEKLSEKVPEEASGEGDTPLGDSDQLRRAGAARHGVAPPAAPTLPGDLRPTLKYR
jgi:hypothetical protein